MKRGGVWAFLAVLGFTLAACGDGGGEPGTPDAPLAFDGGLADAAPRPDAATPSGDILADLLATPGVVEVTEQTAAPDDYRAFHVELEQPADHFAAAGPRFRQQLHILHRGHDRPTVLVTEGYMLTPNDREGITVALAANQIIVEHRYFGTSMPSNDWRWLDIRQAASDHHRVVEALRWLYPRRWINFGASKGGMTAVYHRRFFPDDVYATIAHVAPLSFAHDDPRYLDFVDHAGRSPACNDNLRAFQRLALSRRDDLMPRMRGSYEHLGKEVAFEHSVLELPFFFWQYSRAAECAFIPGPTATPEQIFFFLDDVSRIESNYSDAEIAPYYAYYIQAEHELGYPALREDHLADLLRHPGTTGATRYLPAGLRVSYLPAAMADIDAWVKSQGERLMFVYGEYDPWTAGAFDLGATPRDSFRFIVTAANHNADIFDLAGDERATALDALSRWGDVPLAAGITKPAARRERPRTRL